MMKFSTANSLCLLSGEQPLAAWVESFATPSAGDRTAKRLMKTGGRFEG
jgi:hypothetical protein